MQAICQIDPTLRTLLLSCCATLGLTLLNHCQPSEVLLYQHAWYNFRSEGFVTREMLQLHAEAPLRLSAVREGQADGGVVAAEERCLTEARRQAEEKALRIFLHLKFDIPAEQAPRSFAAAGNADALARDYPARFRPSEMLRAELAYRELLDTAYHAVEEFRGRESCFLVWRLYRDDLPAEIRRHDVGFVPTTELRQQGR